LLLAHCARIDTICDELPRLVALLTRTLEPDVGIGAERDQFLAPAHLILEPPQAPTGRRNEQKQPALVVELVRFLTRLGAANLRITEYRCLTPIYPTTSPTKGQHTPVANRHADGHAQTAIYMKRCFFSKLSIRQGQPGTRKDAAGKVLEARVGIEPA
jgi:hypothetical protein